MKKETKLFWKFFFEQKVDEIWSFIKKLPRELFMTTTAIIVFGAIIFSIVFVVGNIVWFVIPSCHILIKATHWSLHNAMSLGVLISALLMVLFIPVFFMYNWIHSNVITAKWRVERQMENDSKVKVKTKGKKK